MGCFAKAAVDEDIFQVGFLLLAHDMEGRAFEDLPSIRTAVAVTDGKLELIV